MGSVTPEELYQVCRVTLEGREYDGKVLDWAESSEGNYRQIKLEYYVTYKDWNGKTQTRALVWSHPIQSYKLRKGIKRVREKAKEVSI